MRAGRATERNVPLNLEATAITASDRSVETRADKESEHDPKHPETMPSFIESSQKLSSPLQLVVTVYTH